MKKGLCKYCGFNFVRFDACKSLDTFGVISTNFSFWSDIYIGFIYTQLQRYRCDKKFNFTTNISKFKCFESKEFNNYPTIVVLNI